MDELWRARWFVSKKPRCDINDDDDDVDNYICQRLKLEGETENMGVCTACTKERKGDTAEVLMATPYTIHW